MSMQERTVRRPQPREARKPDLVIRAPDPHRRGRWLTVGVLWHREDGGVNIKLNTMPVGAGWDGTLVGLQPLDNGQDPDPQE